MNWNGFFYKYELLISIQIGNIYSKSTDMNWNLFYYKYESIRVLL